MSLLSPAPVPPNYLTDRERRLRRLAARREQRRRFLTHLEARRRELRLTQKQLGDHPHVRIAQDFISRIERSEGLPTPAQAIRIAKVLGIPPESLTQPVEVTGAK